MDWGNGEFVFVDGGNWEFVDMDGGNWQVVTFGLETTFISDPGQSETLAFRGNPVRGSLVGVTKDFLCGFLAVVIDDGDSEFLLGIRLFTSCSIRTRIAIKIGWFTIGSPKQVFLMLRKVIKPYLHAPLPSRLRTSDWLTIVISGALYSFS